MRSSDEPLEFHVDRSPGLVIVPERLRGGGLVAHTERDVFGDAAEGLSDEEWLRRAGEEGWVVLTKDARREGPFVYAVRARGIALLWPRPER